MIFLENRLTEPTNYIVTISFNTDFLELFICMVIFYHLITYFFNSMSMKLNNDLPNVVNTTFCNNDISIGSSRSVSMTDNPKTSKVSKEQDSKETQFECYGFTILENHDLDDHASKRDDYDINLSENDGSNSCDSDEESKNTEANEESKSCETDEESKSCETSEESNKQEEVLNGSEVNF